MLASLNIFKVGQLLSFLQAALVSLLVLLDECPEVSAVPSPGDINVVHLENVPPEGARLDETALTQGTRVGLLARVSHSVASVVQGRVH